MWIPIVNIDQLKVKCKLRQVIQDNESNYESYYSVERLGDFYFVVRLFKQNEKEINDEDQIFLYFRLDGLIFYGFDIWQED
jgi:hypothetical protein